MSKIISIGTGLPKYRHQQNDILQFMLNAYQPEADDRRKIKLLYERSGIETRHSVIPDYSVAIGERRFYPKTMDMEPFPTVEKRMDLYFENATALSIDAINNCIDGHLQPSEITWLITVSCTGLSAPGLDISVMQKLGLATNIKRSSINFMGCYAAIHALKMADNICRASPKEKVLIVCTELCTIHFQKDCDMDSIASGLLFADGSAAVLVTGDEDKGADIKHFYSEVALQGHDDMAWNISGKGFLMRLSSYIPQLLQTGIERLLENTLSTAGIKKEDLSHWAIHPGGKKILESVQKQLGLSQNDMSAAFNVLRNYGNMSSPTILFVLKEIIDQLQGTGNKIFVAAFGPGLTMETLILEK